MDINNLICLIKAQAKNISDEIIDLRRQFHKIPELKMNTVLTEKLIVKILKEFGVDEIKSGVGGHGVVAIVRGNLDGNTIAIRTDCDGLPIKEETNLPFASVNDNMHACGHDVHVATVFGAIKIINENKHYLKGNVKFIFQPYEEGDGGAKLMIDDGVLDNPRVDEIIAMHVHVKPNDKYELGDVLVSKKPTSAGIYSYQAIFKGEQSHVCNSITAINSVHTACTAVSEIAKISKLNQNVINAVTVVNGGVRNNIIPETCEILGSIRSFDSDLHKQTIDKVHSIIKNVAKEFGCSVEIKETINLMPMKINQTVYERFVGIVNSLYPEQKAIEIEDLDMIGEDFARFSNLVPATHFFFHAKPNGECYPLHHPKFNVNETILYKASAVLAGFVLLR